LDNDPLIYINGERNDDARTDLRTAVCRAFKSEDRPVEECKGVSDVTTTGPTDSTQQSTTDGDAMVIANTLVLVLVAIIGVVITGMQ
ncbi:unnamed protein product, partial [Oppiella nova]